MTQDELASILGDYELTKTAVSVGNKEIVVEPHMKGERQPREVPTQVESVLTRNQRRFVAPTGYSNLQEERMPIEKSNTLVKKAVFEELESASGVNVEALMDNSVLTKIAAQHIEEGEENLLKTATIMAEHMADVFMGRVYYGTGN